MHSRAHFRIFGIPVRVEPLFVIVVILFGLELEPLWRLPLWVLAAAVSVLVHELGHALTYRVFGQRSAVVLHGFGGFTVPTGGGRAVLSRRRSLMVSLSGAFAQILLLGIPAMYVTDTGGLVPDSDLFDNIITDNIGRFIDSEFHWSTAGYDFLVHLGFVSVWWGLFNLLPIRPLDGGHAAETLVGFETACRVSIGVAVVAAVLAFRDPQIRLFGLLFFGLLGFLNYRDLRDGQASTAFNVEAPDGGGGGHRGRPARPGRPGRPKREGKPGRGRRRGAPDLRVVPEPAPTAASPPPRPSVGETETRAWNALRSGDGSRAASLVEAAGDVTNPFLRASVALVTGPHEMADDLFLAAYRAEPAGPPNLVPATLLADEGRAVPLVGRLLTGGSVGVEAAGGLQTHLHYAERFRAAAEVGEKVFEAGPRSRAQTAFEVACSWARAGKPEVALRWADRAVDAGFRAPGVLDGEPDLAPVRELPGWSAVRSRVTTD